MHELWQTPSLAGREGASPSAQQLAAAGLAWEPRRRRDEEDPMAGEDERRDPSDVWRERDVDVIVIVVAVARRVM